LKISFGITVHNEAEELNKLLEILIHKTDPEDEIVIVDDFSNQETQEVITSWTQQYGHEDMKTIKVYQRKLNGDFASQKNYVIEQCSGDYIFHLDADEHPHEVLLRDIKKVLEINDVDLVWIPRVNTVEGITQEYMNQWGWKSTEQGWINYPDFQSRIFRNREDIRWQNKVHEHIIGCKTYAHLPPHEELSLYHHKTIDKQEQQNRLYSDILENNRQ
jgi:glycosyltransferase involved in cell wall biosynthesis